MHDSDDQHPPPPCAQASFDIGSTDDSLQRMVDDFERLGAMYRVQAPGRGRDTWVVSEPEAIKRVLLSNHRSYGIGVGLDRVKVLCGNGIIVSEGEAWQRQHRMLLPMFRRAQVERFGQLIAGVNARRLEQWEALAGQGATLNLTREVSEGALEVVLRALLGADLDRLVQEQGSNPFSMLTEESARDLRFAFRFRQLGRHIEALIQRRQQAPSPEQGDWLGMMLAARDRRDGTPMTQRELVDEVMSLIVAGHETTAAVLNAVWYLLSQHPEVEARLHAEVDGVELADLQLDTLEGLQYTQMVILEALRLYPPVWVLTRRCVHADRLLDYELPAGTDVFMSPYLVQRDPGHWSDPDAFRPERFAGGAEAAAHRFAFIPFSAGPRHCIGETFARYEMAIHLYQAARRFRLRLGPLPHPPLEARINLRMREDLIMRVERRA
jgi:cytochrome P450